MKERPILFSGEMVRAILDGRKTQTRRVIKPQPPEGYFNSPIQCIEYNRTEVDRWGEEIPGKLVFGFANEEQGWVCPYGQPGDRLWVRETWRAEEMLADQVGQPMPDHHFEAKLVYSADGAIRHVATHCENYRLWMHEGPKRLRPSIHMPRWASRVTLEITDVRVQRLLEITEDDAKAEGVTESDALFADDDYRPTYVPEFQRLWDSINEKRGFSWESNPWVWVVEFRRVL